MFPFFVIFTTMLLIWCRSKTNEVKPLSWLATILFVMAFDLVLPATNTLAQRLSNRIFTLIVYGIDETSRLNLRIIWDSRTEVIMSNGDRMGDGASTALQLITFFFWGLFILLSILIIRYVLKRLSPSLYAEYAQHFRAHRSRKA
jgi:hypothetical protein